MPDETNEVPGVISSVAVTAALNSIAEFTDAVALIQEAVGSIDQHTLTALQTIDEDVKSRRRSH